MHLVSMLPYLLPCIRRCLALIIFHELLANDPYFADVVADVQERKLLDFFLLDGFLFKGK